jgi:hypothetical protein
MTSDSVVILWALIVLALADGVLLWVLYAPAVARGAVLLMAWIRSDAPWGMILVPAPERGRRTSVL